MKIKKTHAVLLLFVLLGAGLRIIAAHNLDVNPDEMEGLWERAKKK